MGFSARMSLCQVLIKTTKMRTLFLAYSLKPLSPLSSPYITVGLQEIQSAGEYPVHSHGMVQTCRHDNIMTLCGAIPMGLKFFLPVHMWRGCQLVPEAVTGLCPPEDTQLPCPRWSQWTTTKSCLSWQIHVCFSACHAIRGSLKWFSNDIQRCKQEFTWKE